MPRAKPVEGAPDSDEFYYIRDGVKDDTDLHEAILREHDYPIDEKIMGPIRAKYKAAHDIARTKVGDKDWDPALHPRGEKGRWTFSVSHAARLYEPTTKTADEIIDAIPGARAAVDKVRKKLDEGIATDRLVKDGGFKRENGTYTPERSALHEEIIQRFVNPETVEQYTPSGNQNPLLTVLGGRGGSGKSWLTGKSGPIDTNTSLVIDSDEVKGMLPEYEGWNAGLLHEELSDIVAMIDRRAAAMGMNVVLDGTLKSTSILDRIAVYQAPEGTEYDVDGYYMYASPETAATRAFNRWAKGGRFDGRFVPPEVVLGNTKNEANFDKLSESFRNWGVYNNDADQGDPILVEKSRRRR